MDIRFTDKTAPDTAKRIDRPDKLHRSRARSDYRGAQLGLLVRYRARHGDGPGHVYDLPTQVKYLNETLNNCHLGRSEKSIALISKDSSLCSE